MKFWLDDVRPAPEGWYLAHDANDVIIAFHIASKNGYSITHLSLDHDLGDGPTGYDLVKWMAEQNIWPSEWIGIHSANPVGRENMRATINRYSPFHID